MEFEAKKQAILDEEGGRIGYEFFLTYYNDRPVPQEIINNKMAIVTVRTLAEYGIRKVATGGKAFVRLPLDSLLVGAFELLEPKMVGYKIHPPSVGMGKAVYTKAYSSIENLKSRGATIVVHYNLLKEHMDMIQLADIVEFTAFETNPGEAVKIGSFGKKILVSRIDNKRLYDKFSGYADYYQGETVEPAIALDRFKLAPFLKSTLLRLLLLMNTAQSPSEFAKVIETDVGMSAKLLRFINSAFFALRNRIGSIEQAAVYFGLKNLKNFILVLSMNDYASVENPTLWRRALIRAKLMEEFAKLVKPELSSEAYMAGLFSLLHLILDVDTAAFLQEVNVDERVLLAFIDPKSLLAQLLSLASYVEEKEKEILSAEKPEELPVVREISSRLRIDTNRLIEILKGSSVMADTIIHL